MNRKKNDTSVVNKNTGTLSIRLIIIVVIKKQNAELKGDERRERKELKGREWRSACARERVSAKEIARKNMFAYIYIYV